MNQRIKQVLKALRTDDRAQAMTETTILLMMEVGVCLFLLSLANPLYAALRTYYEWFNFMAMWPIP